MISRKTFSIAAAVLFLVLSVSWAGAATTRPPGTSASYKPFTPSELEKIAEPIALYPDVIITQMLPASTFQDQLVDAALFIQSGDDTKLIPKQPWDPSVQAIANYPSVLMSMVGDPDATTRLGDAFLNQHNDLLKAIQRLRARAKSAGNLKSNEQQAIVEEKTGGGDTIIQIQPSDPQVVYVPESTPSTVYSTYSPSYASALAPVATLGLGMAIGYAMGDDDDDHYYYGGWGGGGMWYGDDHYDRWMDHREDQWDDVNNRMNDRQDFRQDMYEDRRNFRQDQWENMNPDQRKQWAQNQKGKWQAQGKTLSAERKQQLASTKGNLQGMSPEQRKQWATEQRGKVGSMSADQRKQLGQQASGDWKSRTGDREQQWNSMSSEQKQSWAQNNRSKIESRSQNRQSSAARGSLSRSGSGSTSARSSGTDRSAFNNMSSRRQTASYSNRGAASRSSMSGGYRGGGGGFRGGGGGRGGGRR